MKTTKVALSCLSTLGLLLAGCGVQNLKLKDVASGSAPTADSENQQMAVDNFATEFRAKLVDNGVPVDVANNLTNAGNAQVVNQTGLNSVLPTNILSTASPFLSGVLGQVGGGKIAGGMDQSSLLQSILSSFTGTTLGSAQGLPASGLSQLFGNIGSTQMNMLPVLSQGGGLAGPDIMQIFGSGFLGGLNGGSVPSNQLQSILSSFTGGIAGGTPAVAGNATNLNNLLQQFNFGIGNQLPFAAGAQGVDMSVLSKWMSGGQTSGLMGLGLNSNLLSGALSMIQMGNMNGLISSNGQVTVPELGSILQGGTLGSVLGMGGGLGNVNQLADLTRLFSQNTMSSLPGLGVNSNILNMLVSNFSQGAAGGLGNIQGMQPNILSMLLGSFNQGAQQGLTMGGVQGDLLSTLLSLVTGATHAGGTAQLPSPTAPQ